jgi:hypothetical protein
LVARFGLTKVVARKLVARIGIFRATKTKNKQKGTKKSKKEQNG